MEASLGALSLVPAMSDKPLPLHPTQLRLEPPFAHFVGRRQCCFDEIQCLIRLPGAFARLRQKTEIVRAMVPRSCCRPVSPPFASEGEAGRLFTTAGQHVTAHDVGGCQPDRKSMLDGECQ